MGGSKSKEEYVPPATGSNEVYLIASKMGPPGMMGFQAYHTSIEINGQELFFDQAGIMSSSNRLSHQPQGDPNSRYDTSATLIGMTDKNGDTVLRDLRQHFQPNTYDLLKKNCNSFSDCALWYTCKIRLHSDYRSLERKGQSFPSIMKRFGYQPNPNADDYDHEATILNLDPKRVFKQTKGYSLKGDDNSSSNTEKKVLTPAELREKRLAAMGM